MDQQTKNRLLESIESDRLVVLCGAGLSMARPSELPAAWQLAETCHDKYSLAVDSSFDPAIRHDLEAIAEYFHQSGSLVTYFIRKLLPWNEFSRPANDGHKALADLLVCRAIFAALSTNYDDLIEKQARRNGADLQVSLDGDEANIHSGNHSPLLKFHGCMFRDRDHTVWTESQLTSDEVIAGRLTKSQRWMDANLREKDFLVVGFWSDWSYLNNVLGMAFENVTPLTMTVVDLADARALEEKAPDLWNKAHSDEVDFYHVQESGSDFLNELSTEFSKMYLRKLIAQGTGAIYNEFGINAEAEWMAMPEMTSEDYFRWRRDAEGLGRGSAPKRKSPEENEVLGFFHLLLRKEGATVSSSGYVLNGKAIRVVNGSGKFINSLREVLIEPPSSVDTDLIVCVGADETYLPANIARTGSSGDILRAEPVADFVTHQTARNILEI